MRTIRLNDIQPKHPERALHNRVISMHRIVLGTIVSSAFLAFIHSTTPAFAQGTAFAYEGRLNDGAIPATGSYDLSFALFDASSGGTQQGETITKAATA